MQLGEVTFRMNLPFPNSFLFLVVRPGAPLVASLLLNIEHRIHFATSVVQAYQIWQQKSRRASPLLPNHLRPLFGGLVKPKAL